MKSTFSVCEQLVADFLIEHERAGLGPASQRALVAALEPVDAGSLRRALRELVRVGAVDVDKEGDVADEGPCYLARPETDTSLWKRDAVLAADIFAFLALAVLNSGDSFLSHVTIKRRFDYDDLELAAALKRLQDEDLIFAAARGVEGYCLSHAETAEVIMHMLEGLDLYSEGNPSWAYRFLVAEAPPMTAPGPLARPSALAA